MELSDIRKARVPVPPTKDHGDNHWPPTGKTNWPLTLDERKKDWPGSDTSAWWLNRRSSQLKVRSVNTIVREIAVSASLLYDAGPKAGKARVYPHILRHLRNSTAAQSVDVVTVADLIGHAKLDSTRFTPCPRSPIGNAPPTPLRSSTSSRLVCGW